MLWYAFRLGYNEVLKHMGYDQMWVEESGLNTVNFTSGGLTKQKKTTQQATYYYH